MLNLKFSSVNPPENKIWVTLSTYFTYLAVPAHLLFDVLVFDSTNSNSSIFFAKHCPKNKRSEKTAGKIFFIKSSRDEVAMRYVCPAISCKRQLCFAR